MQVLSNTLFSWAKKKVPTAKEIHLCVCVSVQIMYTHYIHFCGIWSKKWLFPARALTLLTNRMIPFRCPSVRKRLSCLWVQRGDDSPWRSRFWGVPRAWAGVHRQQPPPRGHVQVPSAGAERRRGTCAALAPPGLPLSGQCCWAPGSGAHGREKKPCDKRFKGNLEKELRF